MKKDIVSIITTCYNAVEYIEYCIGSIAPQHTDDTFSIEYIIVNDASTDNSLDMINKTINHYKNHGYKFLDKYVMYKSAVKHSGLIRLVK